MEGIRLIRPIAPIRPKVICGIGAIGLISPIGLICSLRRPD